MANAFYETRDMFKNYTGYTKPLSFEEWSKVEDDSKAAVLFVQFFDQITLAWYKVKSFYTLEEDGVGTMLDYLVKNVPIIEADPKRFKASYIYKVAFNCLYCICHDLKGERERFDKECSNIIFNGDSEETNIFDLVPNGEDNIESVITKRDFWALIEDQDEETFAVVNKLLGGTGYSRDVETDEGVKAVPYRLQPAKVRAIVAKLQDIYADYACLIK